MRSYEVRTRSIIILYCIFKADIGPGRKGGGASAEIGERSVDHRKDSLERLDKFSVGGAQSLLEGVPGSRGPNVAMILRHRHISQNREAVIGVEIPLYEGVPRPLESTPLEELFSTSSGMEEA